MHALTHTRRRQRVRQQKRYSGDRDTSTHPAWSKMGAGKRCTNARPKTGARFLRHPGGIQGFVTKKGTAGKGAHVLTWSGPRGGQGKGAPTRGHKTVHALLHIPGGRNNTRQKKKVQQGKGHANSPGLVPEGAEIGEPHARTSLFL